MIVFAVVLLIIAVFTAIIGGLAWAQKLPGNSVIGIRVPEVRKTQELWDTAHRIAGPLWVLAGVSLFLGAVLSISASGWMWALVALAFVAWLAFLGIGAGMAAHTVALIDAQSAAAISDGCCSSGSSESNDPAADCGVTGGCGSCSLQGACEGGGAAFQAVDLDAARRAAAASDK